MVCENSDKPCTNNSIYQDNDWYEPSAYYTNVFNKLSILLNITIFSIQIFLFY